MTGQGNKEKGTVMAFSDDVTEETRNVFEKAVEVERVAPRKIELPKRDIMQLDIGDTIYNMKPMKLAQMVNIMDDVKSGDPAKIEPALKYFITKCFPEGEAKDIFRRLDDVDDDMDLMPLAELFNIAFETKENPIMSPSASA